MHHLILGGARSGKSRFAEASTLQLAGQPIYIATARADDKEMARRIAHHQSDRDSRWLLIEEPVKLGSAITLQSNRHSEATILVDCLTLWLSNCLHSSQWQPEKAALIHALNQSKHPVTMVSNEVGSGIVPMGELTRSFVDEAGWLHQELAQICTQVTVVTAGIPTQIK